jgi:ribonuclease HI
LCDGSWGTFGAGAAAVLVAPSRVKTCFAVKLDFSCTNNITEYEALLLGLRKLRAMGIRRAILKTDSQVIAGHVDKSSKARDLKLEKYLDAVQRLEASFEGFFIKNIPRGENEHADLLAKSAAQGLPLPSEVFFEVIKAPLVELMERAVLTISPVHSVDWRTEIISFLQGNCLSSDEAYNKRMEARTRPYVIIEGELYKHGVCSPLLKCLSRTEGMELMKEIHAGLCGSCRRFDPGGSLDRRVNCRRVPQPIWVGARRNAKGGEAAGGSQAWECGTRGLRVSPAPRSGALAVGGYKRPRGRERAALRERRPILPCAANPL